MKTISIHKIHLKCDYDNGSILNGTGESVLFAFTLDKALVLTSFSNRNQFIKKGEKNCGEILLFT